MAETLSLPVKVQNEVQTFKMAPGARSGRILTSDSKGNAYWADVETGGYTDVLKVADSKKIIFVPPGIYKGATNGNGEYVVTTTTNEYNLYYTPNINDVSKWKIVEEITYTKGVAYLDGVGYVTYADNKIYISTNGLKWNHVITLDKDIRDVTSGNGIFMLSGGIIYRNGEQMINIWTSPNGIDWTFKPNTLSRAINRIKYVNGLFIGACANGYVVYSNNNGTTWTEVYTTSNGHLQDFIFNNSIYIFCGTSSSIVRSADLQSWEPIGSSFGGWFYSIATVGNTYVVASSSGLIYSKDNGDTWQKPTSFKYIGYGGDKYVAIAENGIWSGDNLDNLSYKEAVNNLLQHAYFNSANIHIATGYNKIYTSTNGVTWTDRVANLNSSIKGVLIDNTENRAIVFGNSSYMFISSDGLNWTEVIINDSVDIHSMAALNSGTNRYVALGLQALLVGSSNALTWVRVSNPIGYINMNSVASDGSKFVLVGDDCTIATSTDGENWVLQDCLTNGMNITDPWTSFEKIIYTGSKFVICDSYGYIWSSTNGTSWTYESRIGTDSVRLHGYGNSRYFVTHENNSMVYNFCTSLDLKDWIHGKFSETNFNYVLSTGSKFIFSNPYSYMETVTCETFDYYTYEQLYGGTSINGTTLLFDRRGSCLTSSNGIEYTPQRFTYSQNSDLTSVVFDGTDAFVAFEHAIYKCSLGGGLLCRQIYSAPYNKEIRGMVYHGGVYVAHGSDGLIATSSDGNIWTVRNPIGLNINTMCYNVTEEKFYGICDRGLLIIGLANGETWTASDEVEKSQKFYMAKIYANADTMMVIETDGDIPTSVLVYENSIWKLVKSPFTYGDYDRRVSQTNGIFFVNSSRFPTAYSNNAKDWTYKTFIGRDTEILSVVYSNGKYIFTTDEGIASAHTEESL